MTAGPGVIERVEWARPADLPSVVALRAEHYARLWRIYHDIYTVCYGTRSGSDWKYRSTMHVFSPGGTMLMEPGEVHDTIRLLAGPASFRVLFIDPAVMIRAAQELGMSPAQIHFKFA